jgi:hypothetical protein
MCGFEQRVESDLEDLQLANQKVAKSKLSEANASDLDALEAQRELNVLKRSLGEAQLAVQRYERENATLKSQRETLDHKLQIALVEQDTLARELVQVQDELSEMSCRWEQEKSLRENEVRPCTRCLDEHCCFLARMFVPALLMASVFRPAGVDIPRPSPERGKNDQRQGRHHHAARGGALITAAGA